MSRSPGSLPETLPEEIQRQVVAARDHFETAWRFGVRTTIESYLGDLGPTERIAVLHELVGLEIELRTEAGDRPSLEEFVNRFPGDSTVVSSAFASSMHEATEPPPTERVSTRRGEEATGP